MTGVGRTGLRGHEDRGVPGRDHRRPRERHRAQAERHPGAARRRAAGEDGRHRGHERQPRLHRRQAGRRGRVRLSLLQGDDRRHHAHRRDDRGHAQRGPAARPPRRASAPPFGAPATAARRSTATPCRRCGPRAEASALAAGAATARRAGSAGQSLAPLALPLVVLRLRPAAFDWARGASSAARLRARDGGREARRRCRRSRCRRSEPGGPSASR